MDEKKIVRSVFDTKRKASISREMKRIQRGIRRYGARHIYDGPASILVEYCVPSYSELIAAFWKRYESRLIRESVRLGLPKYQMSKYALSELGATVSIPFEF